MNLPSKIWQDALDLYKKIGYTIAPTNIFGGSIPIDVVHIANAVCGGPYGISISDVKLFYKFTRNKNIKSIFIIGNAFGWSAVLLALMFPDTVIDIIDAECEGEQGPLCTSIAKKAFEQLSNNINLHIGWSPGDISKATTQQEYDLIFIDGRHDEQQVTDDYRALEPYHSKNCLIFFHDVGLASLQNSVTKISDEKVNDNTYQMHKLETSIDNVTGMWVFEKITI